MLTDSNIISQKNFHLSFILIDNNFLYLNKFNLNHFENTVWLTFSVILAHRNYVPVFFYFYFCPISRDIFIYNSRQIHWITRNYSIWLESVGKFTRMLSCLTNLLYFRKYCLVWMMFKIWDDSYSGEMEISIFNKSILCR